MKQNNHHVFDQKITNKLLSPSHLNRNKYNIGTCSKKKEDVGILIMSNYNITVNFEYCLLLDTIPEENINSVNETEYSTSISSTIQPGYLKTESKQE